ncbi:MAG: sporulation protein, partial [Comamonadaceae bacterium]|nr:sporulation protein [Comamonadaceae bacterium]
MQLSTLQNCQRGGTFLGLLLGVMIGLGVALGVAIYVAKVPVPFVNKNTSRTTGQDAAEAERNRDWDPNAPLRNRNGARPPAAGGAVVPAPAPAPIRPDETTARPAPPAAPIPAPAEVRPAPPRPEPRTAEKPPEPTQAQQTTPRSPRASDDPLGDFAAAR